MSSFYFGCEQDVASKKKFYNPTATKVRVSLLLSPPQPFIQTSLFGLNHNMVDLTTTIQIIHRPFSTFS